MDFLASLCLLLFFAVQGVTEGMAVGKLLHGTQGDYHLWRLGEGLAVLGTSILLGIGWLVVPTALMAFPLFEFVFARKRGLGTLFVEEPWQVGPWQFVLPDWYWLTQAFVGLCWWLFLLVEAL